MPGVQRAARRARRHKGERGSMELDRQESPPTTCSGWGLVGPQRGACCPIAGPHGRNLNSAAHVCWSPDGFQVGGRFTWWGVSVCGVSHHRNQ